MKKKAFLKILAEVVDSLKSLNAGEYRPVPTEGADAETALLIKEINGLNENTHAHIRREEDEHRKLTAVFDNVAQGIIALDYRKEIVFANGSALWLFGGKSTGTGKELAYLIEDGDLLDKIDAHIGEEEFCFEREYAGKILSVIGKKISSDEEEKALSHILIFTDVTGERGIIRQKSDFFANASHELKTPITVMRGLAEILLTKEDLEEQEKKRITRIHKESLRMADLISDMLKLSKLERNEEEERCEVDVGEMAEEVLSELSGGVESKNLRISLTGQGRVFADPKKIFELVQNLCSNAVNYNRQDGWIKVTLTEKGNLLALSVADGGIGIEKEHLPRLCERFYRVDKSRSKKTGGTGLGLAIVKHICALYKADLEIRSEFGEGTEVIVTFHK